MVRILFGLYCNFTYIILHNESVYTNTQNVGSQEIDSKKNYTNTRFISSVVPLAKDSLPESILDWEITDKMIYPKTCDIIR